MSDGKAPEQKAHEQSPKGKAREESPEGEKARESFYSALSHQDNQESHDSNGFGPAESSGGVPIALSPSLKSASNGEPEAKEEENQKKQHTLPVPIIMTEKEAQLVEQAGYNTQIARPRGILSAKGKEFMDRAAFNMQTTRGRSRDRQ